MLGFINQEGVTWFPQGDTYRLSGTGCEQEIADGCKKPSFFKKRLNPRGPIVQLSIGKDTVRCGGTTALREIAGCQFGCEDDNAGRKADIAEPGALQYPAELAGQPTMSNVLIRFVAHHTTYQVPVIQVECR